MTSGALLLDQNKKEDLSTFYGKRMSRIAWPILFWSAFFLFWTFLKQLIKGNPLSAMELAEMLLSGKPYYHMWYLYMILGLYLFTPFFRKNIAHATDQELVFLVSFMFILAAVKSVYSKLYPEGGPDLFIFWFLSFIPYFIVGYMIRQTAARPSKLILFLIFVLSFLATAFGCYFVSLGSGLNAGLYFYDNLSITVIPMSISIMFLLKTWDAPLISENTNQKIASLTLGIYLIHPIILDVINYKTPGTMAFNPAISIPVIAIFIFVISLVGAWVIYQLPYLRRTI
jgi:surface polysaccharide O-acyltransferase-like enzyme